MPVCHTWRIASGMPKIPDDVSASLDITAGIIMSDASILAGAGYSVRRLPLVGKTLNEGMAGIAGAMAVAAGAVALGGVAYGAIKGGVLIVDGHIMISGSTLVGLGTTAGGLRFRLDLGRPSTMVKLVLTKH